MKKVIRTGANAASSPVPGLVGTTFARKMPQRLASPAVDQYVAKKPTPISLRQLAFYGRNLTKKRIYDSANYVRTELLTRLAHRIRDLQCLPYDVLTNRHLADVNDLYFKAFHKLHNLPEIKTVKDNNQLCETIKQTLKDHLVVIPKLALAALEIQGRMAPEKVDDLMSLLLRSRISRRVIAEQHLELSMAISDSSIKPATNIDPPVGLVGNIFLHCNVADIVDRCADRIGALMKDAYGSDRPMPEIIIQGSQDATFPYILSHLEYIVGEVLRNSFQALLERQRVGRDGLPPPITVTIADTAKSVSVRISDQGGGIDPSEKPFLWSFARGPSTQHQIENLVQVPTLSATIDELRVPGSDASAVSPLESEVLQRHQSSLGSLTSRPPNLRLGIGLGMARIYAEYWAGSVELESVDGYGTDVFLRFSKLGNQNEQLTTRAAMDGV